MTARIAAADGWQVFCISREQPAVGKVERTPPVQQSPRDEEIARAVLSYFLRNPEAADSVEGIARWRLLDEFVDYQVRATAAAIARLVELGYLLQESGVGVEPLYRLNASQIEPARRALQQSSSGLTKGDN
jgi:hypothetical protein